ncbi:MAG: serine hydrolase [Saprospiraceae bacterium]
MKNIYITILTLLCASWISCKKEIISDTKIGTCTVLSNPASSSHPKSVQFQNLLNKYTQKGLPGLNVYVKDGRGLYIGSSGMADIENKIQMTPCHIAKAASITKIIIGVAVLKLQEEGKLTLDDPISKYIDANILNKIAMVIKP